MANPSKQKGTAFESSITNHLIENWDDRIIRHPLSGGKDKGDIANFRITGPHKLAIECKNVKAMNLQGWVREAQEEARNMGAVAGVVVHKRRGVTAPGQQFVTLTLDDLLSIICAARSGQ